MDTFLDSSVKRAESYRHLADCFWPPDEVLVGHIADWGGKSDFMARLAEVLESGVMLDDLRVDFARLFVGPYELGAPPFGSVYLEDGRMVGDSTVDVSRRYREERLDIASREVPDHIAVELEFVHYLIAGYIGSLERQDRAGARASLMKQHGFLFVHLGRWVPEFAGRIRANAKTEFYRCLGDVTETFIRDDMETVAEMVGAARDDGDR